MNTFNTWLFYTLCAFIAIQTVSATNEVVVYWGQDSSGNEGDLRSYCTDSTIDIIVIGFVYDFPTSGSTGLPAVNVAGHCSKAFSKSAPNFLNCADTVGDDITYCQAMGKKVIMSFGGAEGTYGFTSDSQAQTFATTVWNMFLGGTSTTRPFGTPVFDGIDLDIESGKSTGYAAFITQLRTYFTAQTAKTYYITGAPQCIYPDEWLGPGAGTALTTAWFDYLWVQFYNNNCGLNYPTKFNFNVWANWAATISINPNVKIIVGAPASSDAAGEGYVSAATLKTMTATVQAAYGSYYGGIMLWDAGTAAANSNFAAQLAAFVHTASTPTPVATPVPTPAPTQSTTGSKTSSKGTTTTTGSKGTTTTTGSKGTTTTTGSKGTTTTGSKGTTTTTGSSKSSTSTGRVNSSPSTPAAPVSTPVVSTPSSNTATCVDGHMKCASSETYQSCSRGIWAAAQSCQHGLTCSPSGDFVYCI